MNIFVRDKELASMLAVNRSTIWRWAKEKKSFPKPQKMSSGVTVWKIEEINNWIKSKEVETQRI